MKFSQFAKRLPFYIVVAFGVWSAAIAITAITALLFGGWDSDIAVFALRRAGWALAYFWVAALLRENERLRSPAWLVADKAWLDGYSAALKGEMKSEAKR